MELRLEREPSTSKSTPGVLFVNGVREAYTLEDIIRERRYDDGALIAVNVWKIPGNTAIPSGRYSVSLDYSLRFKRIMPHIWGVPGFDGVRIHSGNTAADTEGCILVGTARQSADCIINSRIAFENLMDKLTLASQRNEGIWITIENPVSEDTPLISRV